MKPNVKKFLFSLAIPLTTGGLSTLVSGGMSNYAALNRPPLSPPGWVFPVVWTVLYLLMGYASYRIVQSGAAPAAIRRALVPYALQLFANFLWSPVYFGLEWRLAAFGILLILWGLICLTIKRFGETDGKAGDLLLPYLLWVTFAGYLNFGTYLLN